MIESKIVNLEKENNEFKFENTEFELNNSLVTFEFDNQSDDSEVDYNEFEVIE